jgi:proteasome accessory factor B
MTRTPKLQRLTDLLVALLARRYPVTFAELRRDVPAYAQASSDATVERMFERDKQDLRTFGVPLETVEREEDGVPAQGYRIRQRDFYLPYLTMSGSAAGTGQRRGRGPYASLPTLCFEPDELVAIGEAAGRVRALGDPHLTADLDAALRKLAVDLPVDAARASYGERVLVRPVDGRVFVALAAALHDRKLVTFNYHKMGDDAVSTREAEPYGLVFLGSHWYLIARDRAHGALRHFRLSRMSGVRVNRKRENSPDFETPADFDLSSHAGSRAAWELGDGDMVETLVEFRRGTGAARAAAALGKPVKGEPRRRQFRVRRGDAFTRWLMSFGGDAQPLEPPEMVEQFREMMRETLAVYTGVAQ